MKRPEESALIRKTPMVRTAFKRPTPADKPPKPKKCKACRAPYLPDPKRPFITFCSPDCGAVLALAKLGKQKAAAAKDARKVDRERKQAAKSRRTWEQEAQQAVNAWIRLVRDAHKTCISCGRWHDGQWHCGHYLSRGARPGLRYVESNLAKQCAPCNVHLSGNQVNFRLGLIARIGLEAVEALEADDRPRKYTIEELRAIRDDYRARLRELKSKE